MDMKSGEKLLTLKDIAQCIAFSKSDQGITRMARQIRHWTQSDLLRPESEKETGKGVPRLYADTPTIEIAALLLELARYGATVDILKPVADELYAEWSEYGRNFDIAVTDEGTAILQVAWTEDPETGKFVDASVNFIIKEEPEDEGEVRLEHSSSIVVNMNKVMSRVFPLPWNR